MKLSRNTLNNVVAQNVHKPDASVFYLPERVLQFGTGVLLRGLPDYFIDKANKQERFNGRVVVVKSTAQGSTNAFTQQDSLYTLVVRGIKDGQNVEEHWINASISRVLNAPTEWAQILECAHNPEMQVVISNTTEVGIQLVQDNIHSQPPASFPGKLLAFLYERFKAFGGSPESGMVIVPTELIPDNGKKLEAIILELAHLNGLEDPFIEWLETANRFCSSLVDRIVPGAPDADTKAALEKRLGYEDGLLLMAEVYRLWAIEGDEKVQKVLSFAAADPGVIIAPDIDIYRELKLRLLNGTHTLSCGLAHLCGIQTVKEGMDNGLFQNFVSGLMLQEIAPSIPYPVPLEEARAFGAQVLDRFRNPHLRHQWIAITMQYTSKMKMRCIPVLLEHYKKSSAVPELFALGFAAYLAFTRPVKEKDGWYYGEWAGHDYPIQDDAAPQFFTRFKNLAPEARVQEVLSDTTLWGTDLAALPNFSGAVLRHLAVILGTGALAALENVVGNKTTIE